jgi:hypothetical protein
MAAGELERTGGVLAGALRITTHAVLAVKVACVAQLVTALLISARRCTLYQAGVTACTLAPWRWARNSSSSELDERHDASHATSCTSAHRNAKRGPDVYGEVPTPTGITKVPPFPDTPKLVRPRGIH